MDNTKIEIVALEKSVPEASEIRELNDLQLAMVGGGCGEVVFH